ncbi:UNVERIFIED_CONTAM: hypothetical protein LBW93_04290 [Wolbachia endosymbiont of Nasonia longicornis]
MSIEGLVATASLAAAITTLLIATKVIAGPASLALVASPAGIAVLFIAAIYFAAAAYVSYQQMYKNEEISGAKTGAEAAIEAKTKDLATKTELAEKLNSDDLREKVKGILPTLLVDPDVATVNVKNALANS